MALTSFDSVNLILNSGTGAGRKIVRKLDAEIEEDNDKCIDPFSRLHRV